MKQKYWELKADVNANANGTHMISLQNVAFAVYNIMGNCWCVGVLFIAKLICCFFHFVHLSKDADNIIIKNLNKIKYLYIFVIKKCLDWWVIVVLVDWTIGPYGFDININLENNTWFPSVLPCMYWRIIHVLYHILSHLAAIHNDKNMVQPVYYSPVHTRPNRWNSCIILILYIYCIKVFNFRWLLYHKKDFYQILLIFS